MVGRMQRFMSAVKNDIDQELKNNDLHRLQEELKLQQEGLNEQLRQGMQPVADVIRRPEPQNTTEEAAKPTEAVSQDSEQRPTTAKPEGIST
jgi:sec-independent protein translocase protein TatB